MTSRAFLGYCRNSEVLLGTGDFQKTIIPASGLPKSGPQLSFALEAPLATYISAKGYMKLNVGTTRKFADGNAPIYSPSNPIKTTVFAAVKGILPFFMTPKPLERFWSQNSVLSCTWFVRTCSSIPDFPRREFRILNLHQMVDKLSIILSGKNKA
ncbi:hypothetical protein BGW36DRAFT_127559 [Talaromyces proteolyticus]|uniref:Uncharacterized protein n=1 Tax=Talaromyces proteolyticus TaxID=1131652 RepID=A0AAD4KUR3_9EURO|nr:uncharacterized protein BGW36DRAFT_127559 [Talaromyces proteolyticus]KAH8700351.1 hypothetical protein BGW36DRAFT_127559 [Talaromyces proteolyticus]